MTALVINVVPWTTDSTTSGLIRPSEKITSNPVKTPSAGRAGVVNCLWVETFGFPHPTRQNL